MILCRSLCLLMEKLQFPSFEHFNLVIYIIRKLFSSILPHKKTFFNITRQKEMAKHWMKHILLNNFKLTLVKFEPSAPRTKASAKEGQPHNPCPTTCVVLCVVLHVTNNRTRKKMRWHDECTLSQLPLLMMLLLMYTFLLSAPWAGKYRNAVVCLLSSVVV